MSTKHTPGPWFAVDYAGTYCIQNGPMYEDKDLLSYDSLCGPEQSVTKEEAEANAALMIAAPKMLEALKRVKQDLLDYGTPWLTGISTHEIGDIIKEATKPLS